MSTNKVVSRYFCLTRKNSKDTVGNRWMEVCRSILWVGLNPATTVVFATSVTVRFTATMHQLGHCDLTQDGHERTSDTTNALSSFL